jgi:capsular polysaccharide biosynthesis protein
MDISAYYEAIERQSDSVREMCAASCYNRIPPNVYNLECDDSDLLAWLYSHYASKTISTPKECIYELQGAFIAPNGLVFDRTGTLIALSSNDQRQLSFEECKEIFPYSVEANTIEEAAFIIKAGFDNYFHLMVEILPKLELLDSFSDTPITLLFPKIPKAFEDSIIRYIFPIFGNKFRLKPFQGCVRVARLLYVGPVSHHNIRRSWTLVKFIRHLMSFHKIGHKGSRRLFVSRSRAAIRKVNNQAQLEALFASNGFEIVQGEELNFLEQMGLFSQAAIVAGPLGAGLFNIMYSRPGAQLVVLDPGIYDIAFYDVASLFSAKTSIVFTEPVQRLTQERQVRNFDVNIDSISLVLGAILDRL